MDCDDQNGGSNRLAGQGIVQSDSNFCCTEWCPHPAYNGLARHLWAVSLGELQAVLGQVSEHRHKLLYATGLICAVLLGLGLTLSLRNRMQRTSASALKAFARVNLSLWLLKRRGSQAEGTFCIPNVVPLFGFLRSPLLLVFELIRRISAIGGVAWSSLAQEIWLSYQGNFFTSLPIAARIGY